MYGRGVPRSGGTRWAVALTAWGFVGWSLAACAGEPPEPEEAAAPTAEVTVAESPQDTGSVLRRFTRDGLLRATRTESFAHDPHADIDCATCHEVVAAHGRYPSVECVDCHRASTATTVRALSPAECQSCHHGTEQTLGCEHCHESRAVVPTEQVLAFEVWTTTRSRVLDLDHERHADLACTSCHQAAPALTPAEACASCHEDHHNEAIRCASCHTPAPEGAHGVQAHLTCSGSGCHRAPEIEAIAETRAVCLSCHQELEEHEPGGSCIECHRVRTGPGGRPEP